MTGRHRAPDQPDRPDPRPDRIGAHELYPWRPGLTPVPELLRRLHPDPPERTPR